MFTIQDIKSVIFSCISIYEFMILIRAILSFFPIETDGVVIRFLFSTTEFVLAPIRALLDKTPIGPSNIMIDFSPFAAVLLLDIVSRFLYM